MKYLLIPLLAVCAFAQGPAATGDQVTAAWTSATTAGASGATLTVPATGYGTAAIGFVASGTITGGVVTFEATTATDGNSGWVTAGCIEINTTATLDTTYTLTGANQVWQCSVAGANYFRVRLSTAITGSGTANFTGQATTARATGKGGGSGITQLTGDVTAGPGSGSQAATLATVNAGSGLCGDGTHVCQITTNAKGLTTAQTAVAITAGTGNAATLVTTTFSATPTYTCPSATAGTVVDFVLSTALTAPITSSTLATCTTGSLLSWRFVEDATGGRTAAMPTGFESCPVNPAANVGTKCSYFYDGTNGRLVSAVSDAGYSFGAEVAAPGTPPAADCFSWLDSTAHQPQWKCNNSATVLGTIASGTAALGTGAITSATCATVVTVGATGVATTDVVQASFNGDPTAVTGYVPATTGMLTIIAYPTANNVNFKVCNNTAGSITPGAITLNWRVAR